MAESGEQAGFQFEAGAGQAGFHRLLRGAQGGGEVADRFVVEILACEQIPFGVWECGKFGIEELRQHFGGVAVGLGKRRRLMPEPAFQKTRAPRFAAPVIRGRAAGKQGEPAPEFGFGVAHPKVPDGAEQRLLQAFGGGLFIPAAQHQQVPTEPGRVFGVELTPGGLVAVPGFETDRPRFASTDLIISTCEGSPEATRSLVWSWYFNVGRSFFPSRSQPVFTAVMISSTVNRSR